MMVVKRYIQDIQGEFSKAPPEDYKQGIRFIRPFYWFVIGGLIFLYGFTLYYTPRLRQPSQFLLFTFLMLLHGIVHWISPSLTYRSIFILPYLLLQGSIAFALVLIADNISLSYGLYSALMGEILGVLQFSRWAVISIIYFQGLSFFSYAIVTDFKLLWQWVITAIPMTLFVTVYVALFVRQAQAREDALALVGELEEAHRQLADYAAQVEDFTIKEERQRLARELHDTLAQGLAGLILQLEAADSHIIENRIEKSHSIIKQAMVRARTTLSDARRAIGDLRESPTTVSGLTEIIQDEVERFISSTGISCELILDDFEDIPPEIIENIIRAVREGLLNIAKYAQANEVVVYLRSVDKAIELEISDDGDGFDTEHAVGRSGHYGLLGLRERARIFGGDFSIQSTIGLGTTLRIILPINQ